MVVHCSLFVHGPYFNLRSHFGSSSVGSFRSVACGIIFGAMSSGCQQESPRSRSVRTSAKLHRGQQNVGSVFGYYVNVAGGTSFAAAGPQSPKTSVVNTAVTAMMSPQSHKTFVVHKTVTAPAPQSPKNFVAVNKAVSAVAPQSPKYFVPCMATPRPAGSTMNQTGLRLPTGSIRPTQLELQPWQSFDVGRGIYVPRHELSPESTVNRKLGFAPHDDGGEVFEPIAPMTPGMVFKTFVLHRCQRTGILYKAPLSPVAHFPRTP